MRINPYVPDDKIFQTNNVLKNNDKSNMSFFNTLKENLDKVNDKQVQADNITDKFIKGEDISIHQVMLSTEEAKMSLQLAVQVRNKIVEAYQELNRMQL